MNIQISENSNVPIYEQIEKQLKELIIERKVQDNEPLPSIRGLAKELQISVITTKRAYEELEKQGLVYSVQGKGFFVSPKKVEMLKEKRLQMIEEKLADVIEEVKTAGLSMEDMCSMVEELWE